MKRERSSSVEYNPMVALERYVALNSSEAPGQQYKRLCSQDSLNNIPSPVVENYELPRGNEAAIPTSPRTNYRSPQSIKADIPTDPRSDYGRSESSEVIIPTGPSNNNFRFKRGKNLKDKRRGIRQNQHRFNNDIAIQGNPSTDDITNVNPAQNLPLLKIIKRRLQNSLADIPKFMQFASSGALQTLVNPAINISGLGIIGLPLSERDAEIIWSISRPPAYAREGDIVENPAGSRIGELDANSFELQNPAWNDALDVVISKAAKELGVPGGAACVRAVLHKMVLYSKGATISQHQDPRKSPGVFGTLVICLPSKHEGGDVHAVHDGQVKILTTAGSSEFSYSYLCWYSNIIHEINEVTTGYRLVLTYNLINVNFQTPAKAPLPCGRKLYDLEEALLFWKQNYQTKSAGKPGFLAYVLEHLYLEQDLIGHKLLDDDQERVLALSQICQKHGLLLYLSTLERRIDREVDVTETKESHELRHVVDMQGCQVLDTASLTESQIVQENAFLADPNQIIPLRAGNEHVGVRLIYQRSVAIIMPAVSPVEFVFQSYKSSITDMRDWMAKLVRECTNGENGKKSAKKNLREVCHLVLEVAKNFGNSQTDSCSLALKPAVFVDSLLGMAIRCSIFLRHKSLCCKALSSVMDRLPVPAVVASIEVFGFTELKSVLDRSIRRLQHIHQKLTAMVGIYNDYQKLEIHDSATLRDLQAWMGYQTSQTLEKRRLSYVKDGELAAKVGIACGEKYMTEILVPAFKRQINTIDGAIYGEYDATFQFLEDVAKGWKAGQICKKTAQEVFSGILEDFTPRLRLVVPPHEQNRRMILDLEPILLKPTNIIQLLGQCVSLALKNEVRKIFNRLEMLSKIGRQESTFNLFFLPLVEGIRELSLGQNPVTCEQEFLELARQFADAQMKLYAIRRLESRER